MFSCASANGAVNGIGRGFRPFRDAPSARSGAADAERPRHGTFMLILIIYLYYTECFILCDVVSCGRHARSDGTFMRLFRTLSPTPERDGARGREGAARAEKPMRYRSNDERKMFKDPTRSAVEIGGTSTFGGVILGGRPISEECA